MSKNIDSQTHKLERNRPHILICEYKYRSLIDYKRKRRKIDHVY
jgi:hypothetical protein